MPTALPPTVCPTHFEMSQLHFERPPPLGFVPTRTDAPADSKTVLECRITRARLVRCEIQRETPAGWGFGDWAKRDAESWRVKDRRVSGCPVVGGTVEIVIITRGG